MDKVEKAAAILQKIEDKLPNYCDGQEWRLRNVDTYTEPAA